VRNLHNIESCSVEFLANDIIQFDYINWKGILGHRIVETICIYYGSTKFHPEPQWLMEGVDLIKNEHRIFAMKDMENVKHY
jgi:hypothetical protein